MNGIVLAAAVSILPSVIHAEITQMQGLLEICGKVSPESTISQVEAAGWIRATEDDFGDYASMVADSWTGVSAAAFEYWTGPDSSRDNLVRTILTKRSEMFGDATLFTLPDTSPETRLFLSVEGATGRGAASAAGCFVIADEEALPAAEVSALLDDPEVRPKRSGVGTEQSRFLSDPTGKQRHRSIQASFVPATALEKTEAKSRGNVSLTITCECE